MRILAVIPAYNEVEGIGPVVRKTLPYVDQVLVLDDGSTDGTGAAATAAGALVLRNRRNLGLGRTIRRAYREALKQGADVVVQLDADGQYDADEIPLLLAPIKDDSADMVLGTRLRNLQYRMPWMKRFGNKAFSWLLRRLTGSDVKDGQTGFRAMRREVIERCLPINHFSYTQEMIIRTAEEGFVITSVPVHFYAREHGESRLFRSPIYFAFLGLWIIARTLRDYRPFKTFLIPGISFLLMAIVAGGFVVYHLATTGGISGRVGTLIASGILFLFGVQLIFLGLLADMIRTHTKY
jgi:glycosyltransferase involved in cell wall biosynthesis